MNGFTNAILSILLSWIRLLAAQGWALINSEGGGHFFQFLSQHWKALVLILCVGGFVMDRIIYLFRWRPYYVWRSKLHRSRRRKQEQVSEDWTDDGAYPDSEEACVATSTPYANPQSSSPAAYQEQPTRYAPPAAPASIIPEATTLPVFEPETAVYTPPAPVPQAAAMPNAAGATMHYAPAGSGFAPSTQPYAPPAPRQELDPVFDDDLGGWSQGDTLVGRPEGNLQDLSADMAYAYGSAKPEPMAYLRDMQAGFARPVTPEMLYRSAPAAQPASEAEEPAMPGLHSQVHPGLNMEDFRRNIGLSPAGMRAPAELPPAAQSSPEPSSFHPYPVDQVSEAPACARNPLSSLAKKARGLVGVSEDEDKPTIRDLQNTVDVRTAFHEPVYPKPIDHKEGDDL